MNAPRRGGDRGGNLLLNVGPQADGELPAPFVQRALEIGEWLDVHGEAIYGTDGGNLTEFLTYGRQTMKNRSLYLIFRFWPGESQLRLADLKTPVLKATLITTGQELAFTQRGEELFIRGLPIERPTKLFPVIKLEFESRPETGQWGKERNWSGDPKRVADWARTRGTSVYVDGKPRV